MPTHKTSPGWGFAFVAVLGAGVFGYFSYAAVWGDFGVLRRGEIVDRSQALEIRLNALQTEVAYLENRTRRMSDDYLDLDLLDQQARAVLGLMRGDEILVP